MGAPAEDVERFLIAYAEALSAGDGATVATMWEIPGLVVSDEGSIPVTDAEQVDQFFTAALAQCADAGLAGTQPEHVAIEQLTDRLCSADVRWIGIDAEGRATRYKELSTYLLRQAEDGAIRIQVAVVRPNDGP